MTNSTEGIITLQQLYDEIGEALKKYGNKLCFTCADDEGNNLHPVYFTVTTMEQYGFKSADDMAYMICNKKVREEAFKNGIIVC